MVATRLTVHKGSGRLLDADGSLHGQKLEGLWELVKIAKGGERQEPWILFKKKDEHARAHADYEVVTALPDSVIAKPLKKARGRAPTPTAPKAPAATSRSLAPGRKTALPAEIKPQLATLAAGVPSVGEWLYEIKFDGYRLMARLDNGKIALITRGGHDRAAKMPSLVSELATLGLRASFLDGEIVVLGTSGAPDFNALQNAFDRGRDTDRIVFFVFDAPFFEGHDLRQVPLRDRRTLLRDFLTAKATAHVRFSDDFEADPTSLLRSGCRMQMEGVIAKRADAPYVSRRSETWLKLKCKLRQEFVIGGYTRSIKALMVNNLTRLRAVDRVCPEGSVRPRPTSHLTRHLLRLPPAVHRGVDITQKPLSQRRRRALHISSGKECQRSACSYCASRCHPREPWMVHERSGPSRTRSP